MTTAPDQVSPHHTARVEHDWIDHNGHMNVAWYTRAFDLGADAFLEGLGFTHDWRDREHRTLMAVESHVVYEREAHVGDHLDVYVRMAAHDAKRIHLFCQMFDREAGHRSATCEWMMLQVDFAERRAAAFNADELAWLEAAAGAEGALGPLAGAGRKIDLKAPLWVAS